MPEWRARLFLPLSLLVSLPGAFQCGLPVSSHPPTGSASSTATLVVLPDDDPQTLLTAVASARRRVWVEMYMLTDGRAVDALAAAHAAGADVRVLLEPAPYGDASANEGAFLALGQAGIDVRWFAVPDGLVHIKLLLVDDRAFVLTPNLTLSGLTRNREYAVLDAAPDDVSRAEAVWQADATGGDPGSPSPTTRILVSPLDARARLAAAIDAARLSIALEIEEISDVDLVARLVAAQAGGAVVTVIVPADERSAATNGALTRLASGGVDVRALATPTLHAKAMVLDRQRAYLGSINFTRASLDDNREMGLLLDDPAIVARTDATIGDDWNDARAP
ncbi:MAG TPA: phospholipase D-like domain-containing protein [Polyangia bacterium]|jgi:phosphatidylserine/phosphatidylglycerophosphate/cardiolipin synthase-like enzyme